ncbi:MAG: PRC-barrel domain-containing protein, partial [Clostridia bacterium]|nr:PRC-barrel domain-containing protein [Clostridia bacterium]
HTTIVGRRVVGSGGDDLGCLVDIAFDVGTGRVTGYSLSRGWVADLLEGRGFVEAWAVRAFGPDAIIVDVTGAAGGGSKGD